MIGGLTKILNSLNKLELNIYVRIADDKAYKCNDRVTMVIRCQDTYN